jgi:FKBP-type peptidyl-prolyl cis-trans isomerase 2
MDPFIEPGALVRHPDREDWGLGQVQSVVGSRVTVDFEHAGKQALDTSVVRLVFVGDEG